MDEMEERIKMQTRAKFQAKVTAAVLIIITLLILVPLGGFNPPIGWVSSLNVYRITGGLGFMPHNLTEASVLVLISFAVAVYYVYFRKIK